MCVFLYVCFSKNDATECFRVDGSGATITVDRTCAQEFANRGGPETGEAQTPNTKDTPPVSYSRDCLGNYMTYIVYIYIYIYIYV